VGDDGEEAGHVVIVRGAGWCVRREDRGRARW
jgi:hypothetical protein